MISRRATIASALAVLATASLAYSASAQHVVESTPVASVASAKPVRILQLERVVIVARRLPQQAI